jgi:hypothetical protein
MQLASISPGDEQQQYWYCWQISSWQGKVPSPFDFETYQHEVASPVIGLQLLYQRKRIIV